MKYFLALFLILVLSLHSTATDNPTKIKGRIFSPTQSTIQIGDSTMGLSQSAAFEYKIDLSKPTFYKISYGELNFSIFILPGEELSFSFSPSDFPKSMKYSGGSSKENTFLLQQEEVTKHVNLFLNNNWVSFFSNSEKIFFNKIDSLKKLYLVPLDSFEKNDRGVNATFVFQTRSSINFSFDRLLLMYLPQYSRFTGKPSISEGIIEGYLSKIKLDDSRYVEVEEYATFGKEWLDQKVRKEATNNRSKHNNNLWLGSAMAVIAKTLKNRDVIDFWTYQYLKSHIDNIGIKDLDSFVEGFMKSCYNEDFKNEILSLYNREKDNRKIPITKTYKSVEGTDLDAFIFIPNDIKANEKRPAMVYFHGGSWSEGKPDWQFGYSEEGFINISVDYRIYDRHGALPFDGVSDAKSFFRWLRSHADELHVDTSRIVANGNSAGAHIALCSAMLDTLDEANEDRSISSKPNALILNAGVYDLSQWMWFDDLVKDKGKTIGISPTHHVKSGLPPMLIFHGTNDGSVPFQTAEAFVDKMKKTGNQVDFYPVQNASHELWFNEEYYKILRNAKSDFLKKLGLL